jgi:hypothetical protein
MTRFDQSNISQRSSAGTPRTSARVISGRSAATSFAKSHPPTAAPPIIRSTSPTAVCSIDAVSAATARGVKERVSIRRSREWSGGSMFSIIRRTHSRSCASRTCVAPSQEENVAGSRSTRSTSACRRTSQKPRPAG